MMKKFTRLTFLLIILNGQSLLFAQQDIVKIPCQNYSIGTKRVYANSTMDRKSTDEMIVTANQNGNIEIVSKSIYKPFVNFSGGQAVTTYTYILKDSTISIVSFKSEAKEEGVTPNSKFIFNKPLPFCGSVSKEFNYNINVKETYPAEREYAMDFVQETKIMGHETVTVVAGTFKCIVFVSKKTLKGPQAWSTTEVNYFAEDIGLVKQLAIIESVQVEEIQQNDPFMDKLIEEGLEEIKNGKPLEETEFYIASQNSSSGEIKTKVNNIKTQSEVELIEYLPK